MFMRLANLGGIEEIDSGRRWEPPVLAENAARRATALRERGISRRARVALVEPSDADFFADLLAVWTAGATAACLDPALTASELGIVLDFLHPAAVLARGRPLPAGPWVAFEPIETTGSHPASALPMPDPADPALIMFTSGTTGQPKGVLLSFGALQARIAANAAAMGDAARMRTLVTLPTHFGHGLIGNALTPLLSGGTIVLPPTGSLLAKELGRIIDAYRIGFMSSVPALWRMALKLGSGPTTAALSRVHVGSAPLSGRLWSDIAAWARCEVVNCYGMTETANWFAGASSRDGIEDGLVGRPWEGAGAVDADAGTIRPSGEGEILVRTAGLMAGYLDRPDLTAAVIRDGWYHTGDRGRVDAERSIRLTGRIKDEINRAGFKVQPAELDTLLETHPDVAEACAFALPDPIGGGAVAAAVRLEPGAALRAEELRAWCRERLRREAVPEYWYIVSSLPRSARGKINRDALRELLVSKGPPCSLQK